MKKHLSSFCDGDIICAKVQTAGKGRRSNVWMSNNGDLHISLYLDNTEKKDSIFDVILMITNSLVKVLKRYNIDAKIKYPNDIVVGNKKIAGILVEHIIGEKDSFIIGVGLNVVTEDFSRIQKRGTSIFLETKQKFDYRDVLQVFIKTLNELDNCKSCDLYNMYLDNSVVIGRSIVIDEVNYFVKTINLEGKVVLVKDEVEYVKHMNEISFKEYYDEFEN
jgi:BirA family biotin operon repressor/biotin-[acetyl-CoA-carboxylase] ligase